MNNLYATLHRWLYTGEKGYLQDYFKVRLNVPSLPDSSKQTLQKVRRYLIGNWDSIQRQRDPQYIGCSAEGHVSHWLSARLSLRPLGWSTTGAENIAKAIQYALNYENTFKTLLEDGHLVLSNNVLKVFS